MALRARLTTIVGGLFLWAGLQSSAVAAPILQVSGGVLTGATGVNVGGTLYDVQFVDGSCNSLFNGCTQFALTNGLDATTASLALLATGVY